MKRLLYTLTLLLSTYWATAQTYVRGDTIILTNINKAATIRLQIATKDTLGFIHNLGGGKLEFKKPTVSDIVGLHDSLKSAGYIAPFSIVTLPITGQSIAGGTPSQVMQQIYDRAVPPTYTSPSTQVTSTPSQGGYERGTVFSGSQIALGHNYVQQDGGSETGTTFLRNGSSTSTPVNFTLTSTTTFQAVTTYSQGPIKNDSHGNPYPTGRISAGTATSSTITFTPYDKGYAGYATSALVSGKPIQSDIIGFPITDNSGGSTINSQATPTQGSDKYYCFITTTTRSHVTVNSTPSDAAFNFNIAITFTNASGGTFTGYVHVSKFPGGSTGAVTYVFN